MLANKGLINKITCIHWIWSYKHLLTYKDMKIFSSEQKKYENLTQ